jgi:hypothetical protein
MIGSLDLEDQPINLLRLNLCEKQSTKLVTPIEKGIADVDVFYGQLLYK